MRYHHHDNLFNSSNHSHHLVGSTWESFWPKSFTNQLLRLDGRRRQEFWISSLWQWLLLLWGSSGLMLWGLWRLPTASASRRILWLDVLPMDGAHIDATSCVPNSRVAVYSLVEIWTLVRQLKGNCASLSYVLPALILWSLLLVNLTCKQSFWGLSFCHHHTL